MIRKLFQRLNKATTSEDSKSLTVYKMTFYENFWRLILLISTIGAALMLK